MHCSKTFSPLTMFKLYSLYCRNRFCFLQDRLTKSTFSFDDFTFSKSEVKGEVELCRSLDQNKSMLRCSYASHVRVECASRSAEKLTLMMSIAGWRERWLHAPTRHWSSSAAVGATWWWMSTVDRSTAGRSTFHANKQLGCLEYFSRWDRRKSLNFVIRWSRNINTTTWNCRSP